MVLGQNRWCADECVELNRSISINISPCSPSSVTTCCSPIIVGSCSLLPPSDTHQLNGGFPLGTPDDKGATVTQARKDLPGGCHSVISNVNSFIHSRIRSRDGGNHHQGSNIPMSKLMLRTCPTRLPGRIPRFPGDIQTRLATFLCDTSTPLGLPVVPIRKCQNSAAC
jgi:hypothetical protein